MTEIKIDPEFKNLIPPLTDEEYDGLRDSLLSEGCRDALVLWNDVLVDGHNRYEICSKHGIPFKTIQKDFDSREDAMLWMIDLQRNRRNLSKPDRILLAQKKKNILAKKAMEKQKESQSKYHGNQYDKRYDVNIDNTPSINVRKEIAREADVSTGTLAQFEYVQKRKPEMIESIRKKDMSINQAYKAVRLEEKKEIIKQAEQSIVEQATEENKPILHIGNGIGFVPDVKYDLLLTDPPYSTDVDNIDDFVDSWLFNALDGVKDTGFAYIFIGAYPQEVRAYLNAKIPDHVKFEQILVWTYKNTLGNNPKDRYKLNYQDCLFFRGVNAPNLDCPLTSEQWAVQEINAPDGRQGDRYHVWQKPMEIAERFIRHSTKAGDIVFDPFACTGTFLLASAKLGRRAYGFEINPDNANIAIQRGCLHE